MTTHELEIFVRNTKKTLDRILKRNAVLEKRVITLERAIIKKVKS